MKKVIVIGIIILGLVLVACRKKCSTQTGWHMSPPASTDTVLIKMIEEYRDKDSLKITDYWVKPKKTP